MTTQFPGNLDSFTNPVADDKLNNPSHSAQHTNINDAMEAVQAYIGTTSDTSADTSLTGQIKELQENGGGGGGGDASSVDGWSVAVVTELPAVQDPDTIYFVTGPGGGGGTPANMMTTDTAQLVTGVKTFESGTLEVKDDTDVVVFKVQQQDGNYGSTAVVIDGGNRTNQPALKVQNMGNGVAGMSFTWASGKSYEVSPSNEGAVNRQSTNVTQSWTVNGNAYDTSKQCFLFTANFPPGAQQQPAMAYSLMAFRRQAGQTMDMVQLQDDQKVPFSWIDADGNYHSKSFNVFDAGGVDTGSISMVPDPNSSLGETMLVKSDAGVTIEAPYIVLDTANLQTTQPGGLIGSPLVVTGVDSFGVYSIGYGAPIQSSYSWQDTHTANVVIKATNTAPPTAWTGLGLIVTPNQNISAGTATLGFDMVLSNPTVRTGVLEYGLRVNGGTPLTRDILVSIPANFLQTVSFSIPLTNAYASGDTLELVARVTTNNNNQFSLDMVASASEPATIRLTVAGAVASGAVWGGITGTLSNQTDLQSALDAKLDVAAPAVGVNDNGAGVSLKFWYGTEAQYTAIATKDPNTLYFRSA